MPRLTTAERRKKKGPFWTRRKIVLLIWIGIFLFAPFVTKEIALSRFNARLSESAREATEGRIQQVEVDFSVLKLVDFLRVAGGIVEALRHSGRPVLEHVTLEEAEIQMIPAGRGRWNLFVRLNGISAEVSTQEVFMTRTEIRRGKLTLAPESAAPLALENLEFFIGPSSDAPYSMLDYRLQCGGEQSIDLAGQFGQNVQGRWVCTGKGSAGGLPLGLLPQFSKVPLERLELSGQLSAKGQFNYSAGVLEVDGEYSASDLHLNPAAVPDEKLRKALERVQQDGEIPSRRLRFKIQTDDPNFRWDTTLLSLL